MHQDSWFSRTAEWFGEIVLQGIFELPGLILEILLDV